MNALLLTGLLAIAAKNLVEILKHFTNAGGDSDPRYTRLKGVYALLAPTLLGGLAWFAQNQGVDLDLLSRLGVHGGGPVVEAISSGILAGLAAPEAYDLQNLIKSKGLTTSTTPDETPVDDAGDPVL